MPTAYTAAIDEDISFERFVMRCARAMGACIMLRDESLDVEIPESFKASEYNLKELQKAEIELAKLQQISIKDADKEAKKEYDAEVIIAKEFTDRKNALKAKYQKMLRRVYVWQVPSEDHVGLKEFMIKQIQESIDFDCNTNYYTENIPKLKSGIEWLNSKIKRTFNDINYHTNAQMKKEELTISRNLWLKQLRDSLS